MAKKKTLLSTPPSLNGKAKPQLTWLQLMNKNGYIFYFAVALAFLIIELYLWDSFYSLSGLIIGLAIPIGIMTMIAYKGFYQFWSEYKNGKNR